MKVFISHSHEETLLAEAWKTLLEFVDPAMDVWYSSDPAPGGGTGIGKWREKIQSQLEDTDVVLAIFSPVSLNRPWIFFETALALGMGNEKEVVPIVYYTEAENLPLPLQDRNIYTGDKKKAVRELCSRLVKRHTGKIPKKEIWPLVIDPYLKKVNKYAKKAADKHLFLGHFHTFKTAKKLEGDWWAVWTEYGKNGKEKIFEKDKLKCWTTKNRIRFVGKGAKGKYYPMEGVVSSHGHMALSYWSEGEIPICGTALMELIAGNQGLLGTWQGYTEYSLKYRSLKFKSGRVAMSRDKKDLEHFLSGS